VTLRLRSNPPGAEVLLGQEVIATTPADYEALRQAGRLLLRFRKQGHAERVVEVIPSENREVLGQLQPLRRPERKPGRASKAPPKTSARAEPLKASTPAEPKPPPQKPRRKIYEMEFEH
jgi:hypothetical protein